MSILSLFPGRKLNNIYLLTLARNSRVFTGGSQPRLLSTDGFDFGRLAAANGPVAQQVVDKSCRPACTQSTVASLAQSVEVFAYRRAWLALLFGCSSVLLATGHAGALVGWRTRVPDMLDYVVSMTYNNCYLALPARGGMLGAMQRARILHDLPIAVGNVQNGDDVGRVAVISVADVRAVGTTSETEPCFLLAGLLLSFSFHTFAFTCYLSLIASHFSRTQAGTTTITVRG